MKHLSRALLAAALAFLPVASFANSITLVGTNGSNLSASATFTNNVPGFLQVYLTNTSPVDANDPSQVLTGLFFDLNAGASLSDIGSSATLGAGSSVVYDAQGQPIGGNVGGEWAVESGLNQYGANFGISSSGYGIFGQANLNGPDLEDPTAVDGVQYGILPAGWSATGDNGGLTGSGGLIVNQVMFLISVGGPLTGVGNVTFQYGTNLSEAHFPGGDTPGITPFSTVPDGGATLAMLGFAMFGLGYARNKMAAR